MPQNKLKKTILSSEQTLKDHNLLDAQSHQESGKSLHPQTFPNVLFVRQYDPKQALRMRRYFMAAGTSLLAICLMFVCYFQGLLSLNSFYQSSTMVLLGVVIFYVLFRSGLNLKCRDPNLALPQMGAATLITLYTMYAANGGRSVFIILLLMAFLFSVLQFSSRALLIYAASILVAYGLIIGLLIRFKPQSLDLRLEVLQWLTLALTLPWFATMGSFISGLRNQLRKTNAELASVLQQVLASESSLAEAQRTAGLGSWTFDLVHRSAIWSLETYRLFGIDPTLPAPTDAQFLQIVHPEDHTHYYTLMDATRSESGTIDSQFRIILPTGEIRWVHLLGQLVFDVAGPTTFLRGTVMDTTEHNAQEEALTLARDQAAAARASLVDAIESLTEVFGLFDADDRLVLCNRKFARSYTDFERFEEIAGMRFEDIVRSSLAKGEVIEPAFHGNVEAWVAEQVRRHRDPSHPTHTLRLSDGRWLEVTEQHTRSGGIVGVGRDISEQKQNQQQQAMEYTVTLLLAKSETLEDVVPKIIQTVCETLGWDCGACWHWDRSAQILTRGESWSAASSDLSAFVSMGKQRPPASIMPELIQRVWSTGEPLWIPYVAEHAGFKLTQMTSTAGPLGAFAFPIKIGTELYGVMEFYARDVRHSDPALLAVTRSIGLQIGQFIGRRAAKEEIWQLAFYDPLTRLPNRRLLIDRLEHVQAISTRNKLHNALLFIDLDNFKTINDTLGHDKGDLLLQEVARRLVSCVRTADTVARLGGDEFVIMISELSENLEAAAVQVEQVGEKILMHLNQPYQLADHLYRSTSSIGVTLFSGRDESTDDLLKRADLAMYQAKSAGRNTLRFFEPDMQAAVSARAELEIDLRHGQQDAQFILYYQAQVDHSGRWTGAEALIRWQHPQRGLVSPAEFIPAAEENGLILTLGRWVLETACSQLVVWSLRPETSHLTLAVNVSMRQFRQPDFVKDVTELLELTGADPRMLKLELTESMLLVNVEDIIIKMSALIALGIRFSLDDFGTGYSSLSHLKRLPLDQLKIDQTFVRDVLTDPNDAAIVRTIVALAQSLGLSVIAEGVETESQMTFLSNNGCSAYQGYLFSRPLPLEQFEALHLKENHANAITDLSTPLIR